ncbi:hypothetical protein C8R45DRAFT_983118 [Mycena sanguinolenta]|nr:hypothetical protein C8R45DRAFT_983118 [Mycena sanguinolenta]
MPRVPTTRLSQPRRVLAPRLQPRGDPRSKRVPYIHQISVSVFKIWEPALDKQTISFAKVAEQVKAHADAYGCSILGPRFDSLYVNRLRTLHKRKLIEANFETEEIRRITPEGKLKFENIMADVGVLHTDEKAELAALFDASKKHIGSLKDCTKSQLERLCDEQGRTIKDLQNQVHTLNIKVHGPVLPLADEVVRRVDGLNEPGPSILCTPLRKAVSMGAYPTPDSLPRRHGALVVPHSPPPSPSPQGSFAMDVDYDGQLAQQPTIRFQTVVQGASPAPNPSNADLETELAAVKAKLCETQDELAWYRNELEREKALHAPAQELIVELRAKVSELEAKKDKMEMKQQRFMAKLNKLATEGISDSE